MVEKLTTVFIINVVIKLNGWLNVMGVQVADPNAYRLLQQLNSIPNKNNKTKH